MIEKLETLSMIPLQKLSDKTKVDMTVSAIKKINAIVDAVNKLETMAKNTNTVLKSLVQENNIHEKQIDELQMKLEPEKCKTPADPYAEQRKWIGCLCRFWFNNIKQADIGILGDINENEIHPYFNADLGYNYKCCEPVKPDDSIIYKGEQDEFCRR